MVGTLWSGVANTRCGRKVRKSTISAAFESGECLGTGNLVDEVPVDIQYIGTIGYGIHHVLLPDLIKKRFGHVVK